MISNARANEIVNEIKNGNHANMSELYDALKCKFNHVARAFNNSVLKEDENELFHDTLEDIIENIDKFDESKSGFVTYFSMKAYRKLCNFVDLKETKMRNSNMIISNTYEKDGEEMVYSDLYEDVNHRSSEEEVIKAYEANVLANAIASLKDNYRMVWELIYNEGLKNEAIAKRLGYPVTTIENWYKRGKEKLANMQSVRALVGLEAFEREEEYEK